MQRHFRRLTVATIALTLLIVPLASASIADRLDAKADSVTPNARTVFRGLGINRHAIVTHGTGGSTSSETYNLAPGLEVYMDINRRSVLLITLTTESQCYGELGHYCTLQIRVNGVNTYPTDSDFAIGDSDVPGYQAHSMQRVYGPVDSGSYHIEVYRKVSDAASTLALNYTTLTVQAITQAG